VIEKAKSRLSLWNKKLIPFLAYPKPRPVELPKLLPKLLDSKKVTSPKCIAQRTNEAIAKSAKWQKNA